MASRTRTIAGSNRNCTGGSTTDAVADWTNEPATSTERCASRAVTVNARATSVPPAGTAARNSIRADALIPGARSRTAGTKVALIASSGSLAESATRTGRLLPRHSTSTVVVPDATSRTRTVCGSSLAANTPSTIGTVTVIGTICSIRESDSALIRTGTRICCAGTSPSSVNPKTSPMLSVAPGSRRSPAGSTCSHAGWEGTSTT